MRAAPLVPPFVPNAVKNVKTVPTICFAVDVIYVSNAEVVKEITAKSAVSARNV